MEALDGPLSTGGFMKVRPSPTTNSILSRCPVHVSALSPLIGDAASISVSWMAHRAAKGCATNGLGTTTFMWVFPAKRGPILELYAPCYTGKGPLKLVERQSDGDFNFGNVHWVSLAF